MRILTYNTQMRSALMEMGFPPSIPPVYDAPDRAKVLAQRILTSRDQMDVVCLNEVFDEPAREILSEELATEFPFQVSKADTFFRRVEMPGLSDDISQDVWELVFDPIFDLTGIGMLKFEDSGLFLASRFPFVTESPPFEVAALFPTGVPVVRFLMYADSTGSDKHAAKGVLYARLDPPGADVRHVFMSHAQADYERTGENVGDREKQMRNVMDFIASCTEDTATVGKEVFFCGDLNVEGHGEFDQAGGEWHDLFVDGAGAFSQQLIDRWGSDQCPAGSSGRTDPGFTADVVYAPFRQRLDYMFTSATSSLAVQHLRVDRELADPDVFLHFMSDHHPLVADVNVDTPFCTPATANVVDPDAVDFDDDDSLFDGRVRWYRFDRQGTYDVLFEDFGGTTSYEIYIGDDFSTPQSTYRDIVDPERGTRFVLVAPFFIKVFMTDRHGEASYELRTHRHDGQSLDEAIVLVPGVPRTEHFPAEPFNGVTGQADWDDSESKWFIVQTPRARVAGEIELTVTVTGATEHLGSGTTTGALTRVTVGRWDGEGPPASVLDSSGVTSGNQLISWSAHHDEHHEVLVQRLTDTSHLVDFDIQAHTNLSVLQARPSVDTSLTCQQETSGWGADDIALQIRADGELVADVPNRVIGDFEDGHVRQVGDKLPPLISFVDNIEVKVIEEDDIGSDDVGVGIVPIVDRLEDAQGFTVMHRGIDGRIMGSLQIGVDDGRYGFACVLSRWHPSA
jgi:endonuclease/exonuclease/phosphatase family metal-dependent hydrolase